MTPQLKYHTIAGHHSGKRISCKPELVPTFQNLRRAARSGNYWATIAVRELDSLSSGLDGKSNVYFRPGDKDGNSGMQRIAVFLPGLKATLLRWSDGNFRIVELELDGMYELTKQAVEHTRLGLYRVEPSNQNGKHGWETRYEPTGEVHKVYGRIITVSDAGYANANHAAREIVPSAMKGPNIPADRIADEGCDLHFTPGPKRLGGLVAYNALNINDSRSSARLLAETMIKAKDLDKAVWVTHRGGSSVFTQAMQILADKGITLTGHTAYLYKPKTSPAQSLRLAHKLDMTLNEVFAQTGLVGTASLWSVAKQRYNNSKDMYNKRYTHLWLSGIMTAAGTVGTAVGGASLMGASIPMVGAIVTVITTTGTVYALGQSVVKMSVIV